MKHKATLKKKVRRILDLENNRPILINIKTIYNQLETQKKINPKQIFSEQSDVNLIPMAL